MDSKKLFPTIIGIIFLFILLTIVVFIPCPTSPQFLFFRITLSMAIAGVAAAIPGFFKFKHQKVISAGGAIGVFAFSYIFNPALIDSTKSCEEAFDMTLFIENEEGEMISEKQGTLILTIGSEKRSELLDQDASCVFKQIPIKF